ncbi:MAG: trigger factor [Oscillospiraceae bacterium]|nr:trigger factor [Oscillospiraceae bacterium]
MKLKSVEKKDDKLVLQVKVEGNEFEAAVNKVYNKAKKNIVIPGFRKGKAPRALVEGMYGSDVFYEDAINDIAPEAYEVGMEGCTEYRVVGRPAITNYKISDKKKQLTLEFTIALDPEVELGQYKGLEVYKASAEVTEEEIDKDIANVQKRNSRIAVVEREAKEGDTANIDFDGYLDGKRFDGGKAEGHDLVLGSGQFVPGFEEQVIGMKAGEEKDIDITFPENYHAELAGKAVVFKVKVNEVKETILPELDDDFAKDVSEFDTMAEYRESIKTKISESKNNEIESNFRNLALKKAADNMTVTLPAEMVDERVENVMRDYESNAVQNGFNFDQYLGMMGMDRNSFAAVVRPSAENDLKTEVMLNKIVEVENIEVSEEEIENEYKTASELYNMEIEKLKEFVSVEAISADIKVRKAADLIVESAVVTDKPESEEE